MQSTSLHISPFPTVPYHLIRLMNIYDVALTQNSPDNGSQACHVIGLPEKIGK